MRAPETRRIALRGLASCGVVLCRGLSILLLALGAAACGGDAGGTRTAAEQPAPGPPATSPVARQAAKRGVRLQRVGRFSSPIYVTAPPGDEASLFVVERGGTIRVLRDGRKVAQPFLDISGQTTTDGERGLLSMAFPPDHAESGLFYIYFTDTGGDTKVVEYKRAPDDPDRADPASARTVLTQDQPEPNHNGGPLVFGPDGLLYIGLGDGGGAGDQHGERGNGQDLGTLLGKLLRIDPRRQDDRPYAIPRDNPFVDRQGARGEIFSYGLRNPWRFSFDRRTEDLVIADVGQDSVEEVNFGPRAAAAGANFGWRPFEGSKRFAPGEDAPGHVRPVLQKPHSQGFCSITGGYVVRDPELPALAGRYVYGDLCEPSLRSAKLGRRRARGDRETGLKVPQLVSFGEDARGRVYVASLDGPVYRLAPR